MEQGIHVGFPPNSLPKISTTQGVCESLTIPPSSLIVKFKGLNFRFPVEIQEVESGVDGKIMNSGRFSIAAVSLAAER